VDLEIRAGEIHALCGENGAGKSTLIKILGGVLPHGTFQGEIARAGRPCRFKGPRDSLAAGIRIIFQELALAPDLSVAENVFLGRETARGFRLQRESMEAEAARRLALLGLNDLDPAAPVRTLPVGLRQMVEIARALEPTAMGGVGTDGRAGEDGGAPEEAAPILILDEPTSALSLREAEALLAVLARLKARGLGLLYVSHKLEEVFAAADRISVLRNGRSMGTLPRAEADPPKIVSLMVGRALEEVFPPLPPAPDPAAIPALSVRDWTVPSSANPAVDLLSGISFDLRPGEILGLAGLMGAGRTELAESLFGLGPSRRGGSVTLAGAPYAPSGGPPRAVARGLALVPEDRRRNGLWLEKPIRENVSGACLSLHGNDGNHSPHARPMRLARLGVIDGDAEARLAADSIRDLGVKAPHGEFAAGQLSGGNQQKVVLAKWLAAGPRVLFLDDPTRGVDVGAKAEIYRLIGSLAGRGLAILLISSELDEVLRLSHRILVLRGGRIAGEFAGGSVDKETILAASAGGA
jgi:D-xylose transport system ATP-binding protein